MQRIPKVYLSQMQMIRSKVMSAPSSMYTLTAQQYACVHGDVDGPTCDGFRDLETVK